MTKISKQEMIKLAKTSHIAMSEDELDALSYQLEDVLTYAARVKEIAGDVKLVLTNNQNVFRGDQIQKYDSEIILAQAPERADNFFVVPSIIETK